MAATRLCSKGGDDLQEEVESKTVNLAVSTTKLTARALIRGIRWFIMQRNQKKLRKQIAHQNDPIGEQSVTEPYRTELFKEPCSTRIPGITDSHLYRNLRDTRAEYVFLMNMTGDEEEARSRIDILSWEKIAKLMYRKYHVTGKKKSFLLT